jgi:DNA-binding NarL/FixJ family response regulator
VTRILIADDHEVVRSGLRKILEAQAGWEVVAEVGDGIDAITKAIETKPDVAVLDYSLPRANGTEVARQIRARLPTTEILIFTMHDNEHLVQEALRAGARGYLLKSDAKHHLIDAIRSLEIHRPFFTSRVSEALLGPFVAGAKPTKSVLSNRERGVVQLIAEGYSNKQIASILSLSIKTVETHRSAIMRKLDLHSSAAIVRYAVRKKFLEA